MNFEYIAPRYRYRRARRCYWCGHRLRYNVGAPSPYQATRDHVVPRAQGGAQYGQVNVVAACRRCNEKRGRDMVAGKLARWVPYHLREELAAE